MEPLSKVIEEELESYRELASSKNLQPSKKQPTPGTKHPMTEFPPEDWTDQPTPSCARCGDFHFLRMDAEVDDPRFGKSLPCPDCSVQSDYRFDTFNAVTGSERAVRVCQEYAKGGEKPWLLIHGVTGSGKTHLSQAVRREFQLRMDHTMMVNIPELLEELRASYNDDSHAEALHRYMGRSLLILDDFGVNDQVTSWAKEQLYMIINARYRLKAPTVFTTNLTIELVAEAYGQRIADRMWDKGMTSVAVMTCKSYRTGRDWS